MTIEITRSYTRVAGDGVTTVFNFAFRIFSKSDVVVRDIDPAGTLTTLRLDAHYSVAISTTDEGGSITLTTAVGVGHTIDIRRLTPLVQAEAIRSQGSDVHERALDKLAAQIQDSRRLIALSPRLPDSELPTIDWDTLFSLANRKGKYFGFNATSGAPELFTSLAATALSQSSIGQSLFPQTRAEVAAGVMPLNYPNTVSPSIDPRRYGLSTTASAAINAVALQSALNVANHGGGEVLVPEGQFDYDTTLLIHPKTTLRGMGRKRSILNYTGKGDGIDSIRYDASRKPLVNASVAADICVRDLGVITSNAGNTGGGFVDVCGTFVQLHNVYITGFEHQVIFDQTEVSSIRDSEFLGTRTSCLWLVNGDDHTPGAKPNWTNRITIDGVQFNSSPGCRAQVIDDGGGAHSFVNNNFNAGQIGIRAAGVFGLKFSGNYCEVHGNCDIQLTNTTFARANVEPCTGLDISGNLLLSKSVSRNIDLADAAGGRIAGNIFGQASAAVFIGAKATGVTIEANSKLITGPARTAGVFVGGTAAALRQNIIRQTPQTYVASALGATGLQIVTPAAMEGIHIGSRLACRNSDNSNFETVIVTAATGNTFAATFASTKSANWVIYGITPANEEEGIWTPAAVGTGTAGIHVYVVQSGTWSRRGNLVHVKGHIEASSVGGWTANIRIAGLPFVAENIAGTDASVQISAFSGFTLAGGGMILGGVIAPNTSYIDLRKMASGVPISGIPVSDVPGGKFVLCFDATYYTSSN